jgi:hypothetical protein
MLMIYPQPDVSYAAAAVLNNWQISGVASFISQPTGVTFITTSTIDITESPTDLARLNLTGDPVLSNSERTFDHAFLTEAFSLPAVGTHGNPGRSPVRQPGISNWDVAIFKNVP